MQSGIFLVCHVVRKGEFLLYLPLPPLFFDCYNSVIIIIILFLFLFLLLGKMLFDDKKNVTHAVFRRPYAVGGTKHLLSHVQYIISVLYVHVLHVHVQCIALE